MPPPLSLRLARYEAAIGGTALNFGTTGLGDGVAGQTLFEMNTHPTPRRLGGPSHGPEAASTYSSAMYARSPDTWAMALSVGNRNCENA